MPTIFGYDQNIIRSDGQINKLLRKEINPHGKNLKNTTLT